MMVQLTPPKRYTIITDYSNGKKTILESEDGFWVKYTNAKDYTLNYANELAKQARLDALEEAAKECDRLGALEQDRRVTLDRAVQNWYRARDAIRKLKEGV